MPTETQTLALVELTAEQIVDTARSAREPGWMIVQRDEAWQHFAEAVPPEWRRTDLRKFKPDQVTAPIGVRGTTLEWDSALADQGVIFMPLQAALRDHEELVKQHLGTAVDGLRHKFGALHTALWQDGVFLYVPKNVAVETPLHATFTFPEGSSSVFPHNLVVLERGANAIFIEEFTSGDMQGQAFASPATELILGEGSSLRFVTAQTWGKGVYHIGAQIAQVGDDATLDWAAINLGGKLQHVEAETFLSGTGSRVNWLASTFAVQDQALLTAPWLRHIGVNTEGHMDFKTVVNSGGYTTFDGMIKIEKGSRGTISRLEDHAIHLGDKARSDSIPGLMIDTNDVQRAGHASTSGEVDAEMLFYMQSRGIKREDAMRLIITGFFEKVLDQVPSVELRERFATLIDAKI